MSNILFEENSEEEQKIDINFLKKEIKENIKTENKDNSSISLLDDNSSYEEKIFNNKNKNECNCVYFQMWNELKQDIINLNNSIILMNENINKMIDFKKTF